jgi:4-hydroxymandelate oxidase
MNNDRIPFLSRRKAFLNLAGLLAASPLARAQRDMPYDGFRIPPLEDLVNVFEFEPICKARIPRRAYDFISGGVDQEWTLRRNRDGFDKFMLRPRFLVDTSALDLSTTIFGEKIAFPVLIAPTAGHQQAHPEGELATARGAAAAKTIMVVSSNSSYPIDKVSEASPSPKWFQLYAVQDLDFTRERVERAVGAGCKLICWTVDGQYNSHRERLLHNRLASAGPPGHEAAPHPYSLQPVLVHKLDWRFLETLKKWAKLPVIIKGILTAEDAELCVKYGADGMVVSNHGGRYLDYAPSTIEVLPEIVDAVGKKLPILVDSGFRRGTDILKALAIGAQAVLVGRPVLWGLGAYGQAGVERVLKLLETELALAMGLSGKPNIASLDRSLVRFDR